MFILVSWMPGAEPTLDFLPINDPLALLVLMLSRIDGERSIALYRVDSAGLQKVFPVTTMEITVSDPEPK